MQIGYAIQTDAAMLIPIVTYHYVRPLSERFSNNHKSLDLIQFVQQIEVLKKNYFFVKGTQIHDLQFNVDSKGRKPVWLSFDDGYSDHYKYVYPELMLRGAVGSFFIPTEAIFERKLLDVNKIHLILAANPSTIQLINEIREIFDTNSGAAVLGRSFSELREEYSVANLTNDPDTRFVKLLLQEVLPKNIRKIVLNELLSKYIRRDESAIVDELYMNPDQIKVMHGNGMNIGSHGHAHSRFEFMSYESQMIDIDQSLKHFRSIGIDDANVVVCYPYGSFNAETKAILSSYGCLAAISLKLGVSDTNAEEFDWLELQRIDTKFFNEFFTADQETF